MPATYTTSLSLTLPATGDTNWGNTVNNGITSLVDDAVAGTASITMVAADYTLTTTQGATNEARKMFITATGSPGAARNIIVPAVSKLYFVFNNTTGGFAQTVKTASGSGISVPNGARMVLYCNGTDVVQPITALLSPTFTTPALGTPASGVLSSCTGLPISTGISGLGTGVATFLATPNSANLAAAVTDETGSGALVFGTSPTLSGTTLNGTTVYGGSITPATNTVDSAGYTGTPVNSQSAAYQLVAADAGKSIVHPITDNNARTFTIPANSTVAFPVGTTVTFINMINTVSIAITSDTMYLAGTGSTGTRTLAAYGMATAVKVTSTSWIISGNGLT